MEEFHNLLKEGMAFEDNYARPVLLSLFPDYWVESTHSHKTYSYSGPVMENTKHGRIILPDFRLYEPIKRHMILAEAKYRKRYFHIPGNGTASFVAIDAEAYYNYTKAASILGADLLYIFGVGNLGKVFMFSDYTVKHQFHNTYYRGDVYAFRLDDNNIIGDL